MLFSYFSCLSSFSCLCSRAAARGGRAIAPNLVSSKWLIGAVFEWSKQQNSCPFCRKKFSNIKQVAKDGKKGKVHRLPKRNRDESQVHFPHNVFSVTVNETSMEYSSFLDNAFARVFTVLPGLLERWSRHEEYDESDDSSYAPSRPLHYDDQGAIVISDDEGACVCERVCADVVRR